MTNGLLVVSGELDSCGMNRDRKGDRLVRTPQCALLGTGGGGLACTERRLFARDWRTSGVANGRQECGSSALGGSGGLAWDKKVVES